MTDDQYWAAPWWMLIQFFKDGSYRWDEVTEVGLGGGCTDGRFKGEEVGRYNLTDSGELTLSPIQSRLEMNCGAMKDVFTGDLSPKTYRVNRLVLSSRDRETVNTEAMGISGSIPWWAWILNRDLSLLLQAEPYLPFQRVP